jgi:hypothetical protein
MRQIDQRNDEMFSMAQMRIVRIAWQYLLKLGGSIELSSFVIRAVHAKLSGCTMMLRVYYILGSGERHIDTPDVNPRRCGGVLRWM